MDASMGDLDGKNMTFPFGSYDIFSYVIPGSTALLCVYLFEFWCHANIHSAVRTPLYSLFAVNSVNYFKDNLALSALYLLALICVVYVSGHIVSSVSSFALDRIYTAKGHGYPFETLLLLSKQGGSRKDDSKGFYQGFFFWFNTYLALRFVSFLHDSRILRTAITFTEILLTVAIALKVIIGIYRSKRSRFIPDEEALEQTFLKKPAIIFARSIFPQAKKAANFFLVYMFPLFYNIISRFAQHHLRTARPFSSTFIESYRQFFFESFDVHPEEAGSNNFWFCRLFITDQSPIFDRYLIYWLHIYSYARNLATSFYLAFIYCFWWTFLHKDLPEIRDLRIQQTVMAMPLLYFFLSAVLLVRFRYIYVGYYNRFLFRGFIYLCTKKKKNLERSNSLGI